MMLPCQTNLTGQPSPDTIIKVRASARVTVKLSVWHEKSQVVDFH
jgi:hypothetical protein